MDLKMFLGDDIIDTIKINAALLNMPYYLESLKVKLEERNEEILDLSNEKISFCIEGVPSSMNYNRLDTN